MNTKQILALLTIVLVALPALLPLASLTTTARAEAVKSITTTRDTWGTVWYNTNFTVHVLASQNLGSNITLTVSIGGGTPIPVTAFYVSGTAWLYEANFSVTSDGTLQWYNASDGSWVSLGSLEEGTTITITEQPTGKSVTLTFEHQASKATIRTDVPYPINRTGTGDWLVTAPDLNKDPYSKDKFIALVEITDYSTGSSWTIGVPFEETSVNSGNFTPATITLTNLWINGTDTQTAPNSTNTTSFKKTATYNVAGFKYTDNYRFIIDSCHGVTVHVSEFNGTHYNATVSIKAKAVLALYNGTDFEGDNVTVVGMATVEITNAKENVSVTVPIDNVTGALGDAASLFYNITGFTINVTWSGTNFTVEYALNGSLSLTYNYEYIYGMAGATAEPGDIVRVLIKVPEYQGAVDSETASIEPKAYIDVFRTAGTIEAANATMQKIYVRVSDLSENKKSYAPDEVSVEIYFPRNTTPVMLTLTETDDNTGVFEGELPIFGNFSDTVPAGSMYFNGTFNNFTIVYKDPSEHSNIVEKTVKVVFHKASIELQPTQIPLRGTVRLIVSDADLNYDPSSIQTYELDIRNGNFTSIPVNITASKTFAKLSLYLVLDDGSEVPVPVSPAASRIILVETDVNTGEFVAVLRLDNIIDEARLTNYTGGHDVESIKVVYTDLLTPEGPKNVTAEASVKPISISLDRTEVPLSRVKDVIVYITVNDPSANKDAYAPEEVNVTVTYMCGTDTVASFNVTLEETGVDTGVFTGAHAVDHTIVDAHPCLIDGKLVVSYTSAAGSAEKEVPFRVYDASLSVNTTAVKYGDAIKVTVRDPEANADTTVEDSITVTYGDGKTLELTETGPDTGVFEGVLVVDSSVAAPHTAITFSYTDKTSPSTIPETGEWQEDTYTKDVTVLSFTGKLTVDGVEAVPVGSATIPVVEVGIRGSINVTVVDPDANKDPESADSINVTLKPWSATLYTCDVTLDETGPNTGVFTAELEISDILGCFNASISDAIGKTFHVFYLDQYDESGLPATMLVGVKPMAWTGEITTDKDVYTIGEWMYITVTDKDRAGEGSIEITAYSSSLQTFPATIVLRENGTNTGVFVGRAYIAPVEEFSPTLRYGIIYARPGDTITVEYTDTMNATGAEQIITKIVSVRAPGVPMKPAKVEEFSLVEPATGAKITAAKAGSMVSLAPVVANNATTTVTMFVKVVVKDSEGVTVYIGAVQIPVPGGETATPMFFWTPEKPGTYTVQVYILKSVTEQSVTLTEKLYYTYTVEVTE